VSARFENREELWDQQKRGRLNGFQQHEEKNLFCTISEWLAIPCPGSSVA
jgi:hypothetical protein